MKKILLLTNIYPNNDPNYKGTAVCHTFTTEWVKMGYDVSVIHFDSLFPRLYYWVGKLFNSRIQAMTGTVAYANTPRHPKQYKVDGVSVLFVPLKKFIPHKAPSQYNTEKAFAYIVDILKNEGFEPDVVTAHFTLPQLQFLPLFKKQYPNVRTCLVLHGNSSSLPYFYPKSYQELMKSVDVWGFRSQAFKNDFEARFGKDQCEFICYSGIPEKYINVEKKDCTETTKHFVFVGSLYKLKNVDVTIRALNQALGESDYSFDIVGDGAEYDNLKKLVNNLGVQQKVIFHGRKSRDDAQKILEGADCFVMVSSREAFGLVYVEAMAKGLIVVGTKGQGIDGVVKNGENGFLCESNNVDELSEIITTINNMSIEERQQMSDLAINTAKQLTDRKVAEYYINSIIEGL